MYRNIDRKLKAFNKSLLRFLNDIEGLKGEVSFMVM